MRGAARRQGRVGAGRVAAWSGAVALAAVAVVALAACGARATPGWTYGPVLVPSAAASSGPVPTPAAASPGLPASPGPSGSGPILDVTARNIAFTETQLTFSANQPLTIHFDNEDAGVPHDISIRAGSANGQVLFTGDIITGVGATDYQVGSLAPGTYTLVCTVHPTLMIATLTVK